MIDAIFFDLDGTLIDTESVAIGAGRAAFAALGHQVDDAFLHSLVGVDLPSSAQIIQRGFPHVDQAALNAHWRAGFDAAISLEMPLKAGAVDLLETLRKPIALVTSSARDAAHYKLRLARIDHHFDHVITVDDVTAAKPAPDPYLLAAQLLGVTPARCLVFEDSETGAEAAHRAGCIVVQVPDVVPSKGRWAHHLAPDLLSGARHYGLI